MSVITKEVKASLKKEYDEYAERLRLNRLVNPKGIRNHEFDNRGDYKRDGSGNYVYQYTPIEDTMSLDAWIVSKYTEAVNSHLTSFASEQSNQLGYRGSDYEIGMSVRGAIIDFLELMLVEL